MSIKKCFVPCCANSSNNAPRKIFFMVPVNYERRKRWFEAVNRNVVKSLSFCCQDHFDLESDSSNFMYYKLSHGKLLLKLDAIPHKYLVKPYYESSPETPKVSRKRPTQQIQNISGVKKKLIFPTSSLDTLPSPSGKISIATTSAPLPTSSPASTFTSFSSPSGKISVVSEDPTISTMESTSSESSIHSLKVTKFKEMSKERIVLAIELESRFYLGLPKDIYFITHLLSRIANLRPRDILITLKKIRLNDPYLRLGMDFGIDQSYVGKIFNKTLKVVAQKFSQLIFWPSPQLNKRFMPIPFRLKYSGVQSIIDCFEISIEKPSNPQHQALTWSAYKHCNTLKYLISCTPYGCVNFVSCGYGGRASDVMILQDSDYLDKLPNNCSVMADRGFKNVSDILKTKNCTLVRPPSVSSAEKLSKAAVREGRSIAALRIHVERVIGRLREFQMLSPHACIDIHLLGTVDAAVLTACGIINLQPALINM